MSLNHYSQLKVHFLGICILFSLLSSCQNEIMEEKPLDGLPEQLNEIELLHTPKLRSTIVDDGVLLNWNNKHTYHFQTHEIIPNFQINKSQIIHSDNFILIINKDEPENSFLFTVGLNEENNGKAYKIMRFENPEINIKPKVIRGFGLAKYASDNLMKVESLVSKQTSSRTLSECNGVAGGVGSQSCSLGLGSDVGPVGADVDCSITCDPGYHSCCDPFKTPSCYCISNDSGPGIGGGGSGSGSGGGGSGVSHCVIIDAYIENGTLIIFVLCHEH